MNSPSNSGDRLACSLGLPGSRVAPGWSRPVLRDGDLVGITSPLGRRLTQPLSHGEWRGCMSVLLGVLQVMGRWGGSGGKMQTTGQITMPL